MMETLLPGMAALKNNIHPLLIHFPIAFFLGALAMEGMAILRGEKFHFAATWMLYLGTFSALVALPTGFIAADLIAATDPRGHRAPGHELIHLHRNWMVATTAAAMALSVYLFRINRHDTWRSRRWGFFCGVVILSFLVAMGADRGGRLVFEFGVGVNPGVLKETAEEPGHGH
ncbi:MAG: DUF2231 domain-containing protein [Candidatus Manganitrophus sp.]|nr:MAG: DUF2231 domain-containing protein [Candidatus Manganitrophus sp.]